MKLEIRSKSQLKVLLGTIRGIDKKRIENFLKGLDIPEKVGKRKMGYRTAIGGVKPVNRKADYRKGSWR